MKTKKLHLLMLVFFAISVTIPLNSCDEIEDIVSQVELFSFEYMILPDSIDQSVARSYAEAGHLYSNDSEVFFPEDVVGAFDWSNTIKLYGDPTTSTSQLLIRMERNGINNKRIARYIHIDVLGPFSVGSVHEDLERGSIDVYTGLSAGPPWTIFTTDIDAGVDNVYYHLEITTLNTVTKRIGGNFHAYTNYKFDAANDPSVDQAYGNLAILVHSGAFLGTYGTR